MYVMVEVKFMLMERVCALTPKAGAETQRITHAYLLADSMCVCVLLVVGKVARARLVDCDVCALISVSMIGNFSRPIIISQSTY